MGETRHHWTFSDDLVAFHLERYGHRHLPVGEAKIAKILGIKESSLIMRKGNFAHLGGRGGLEHVAEQSRDTFARYKSAGEAELRPMILGILRLPAAL